MAEYLFFKERSELEIWPVKLHICRKNADMSIRNLKDFVSEVFSIILHVLLCSFTT